MPILPPQTPTPHRHPTDPLHHLRRALAAGLVLTEPLRDRDLGPDIAIVVVPRLRAQLGKLRQPRPEVPAHGHAVQHVAVLQHLQDAAQVAQRLLRRPQRRRRRVLGWERHVEAQAAPEFAREVDDLVRFGLGERGRGAEVDHRGGGGGAGAVGDGAGAGGRGGGGGAAALGVDGAEQALDDAEAELDFGELGLVFWVAGRGREAGRGGHAAHAGQVPDEFGFGRLEPALAFVVVGLDASHF